MNSKSIMHVSFYVEDLEKTRYFYEQQLGFKAKMAIPYKFYQNSHYDFMNEMAEKHGDKIAFLYLEVAPGQFIEIFPKVSGMKPHRSSESDSVGYSHFAILVEDIFSAREEIIKAGIVPDTEISKGPTETYKFWIHDPDGNRIEIMQFTEKSLQIKGYPDKISKC